MNKTTSPNGARLPSFENKVAHIPYLHFGQGKMQTGKKTSVDENRNKKH